MKRFPSAGVRRRTGPVRLFLVSRMRIAGCALARAWTDVGSGAYARHVSTTEIS